MSFWSIFCYPTQRCPAQAILEGLVQPQDEWARTCWEIGLCFCSCNIIWVHSPFPGGQWPDVKNISTSNDFLLEDGEKAEADDGYNCHKHSLERHSEMFCTVAVICQLSIESSEMKLFDVIFALANNNNPQFFSTSLLNTSVTIKY